MVKPLFFVYPEDKKCKGLSTQYMVGDSIMVAPVLGQEETERIVYFPKGKWIDYETGKSYVGGKSYLIEMPLDKTGIYIKNNSIIPTFEPMMNIDKEKIDTLTLKVFGSKGSISLYDDDGKTLNYQKGEYNIYKISCKSNTLTLKTPKCGYKTPFKTIKVVYNGKTVCKDFSTEVEIKL